ncbi:hypothetical protein [Agromyces sp. SYSU T0242]|uniref:hypothetical protein n=1 Tax=Agromyces litoreus TaxID=3158561 RepID=UPI003396A2D5
MTPAIASVLTLAAAAAEEFDEDDVTPGVVGFVLTILVMVAVLLLILDMVRRIRRVNYRAEARERIAAEQAAAEGGDPAGTTNGPGGSPDEGVGDAPPVDKD